MIATGERTAMSTMTKALTGERMIERFTLQGTLVLVSPSEALLAMCLAWWGYVLLPSGPTPGAGGVVAFEAIGGAMAWGIFALVVGSVQLFGIVLARLGIAAPHRTLRLAALSMTCSWWVTLAVSLLLTGSQIGPVIYGTLAFLTWQNYRRVWLNGAEWMP